MKIERTDSTNSLMKELLAKGELRVSEDELFYVRADYQTAGRGQAGNGWESEAGKNLLCSVLISRQPSAVRFQPFDLNVLVSVAVHKAVMGYGLRGTGGTELTIKWPNDIYWGDKKLAGILIEGAIEGGEMQYAIAGIGLNVNQTEWKSDAPNPISMKQIKESCQPSAISHQITNYNLDELMERIVKELKEGLSVTGNGLRDIWEYYRAHMYRREGWWPFAEREVSVEPSRVLTERPANTFLARIKEVTEQGELVLETKEGIKKYHFKEIQFVL